MKVGVIGGGPAGIIAAGFAGLRNKDVTLIERNDKLGKNYLLLEKAGVMLQTVHQ